ncbi:MAG TPA: DUF72 domain-containing protein [Gammaproteobacteria bacterium]|nr:DUF72 domain-containing protein [Gammaproteobacteria bacterium]
MRLLAGTSGFSYKEWLGEFYPDKLAANKMLGFYATRLPAVEINNTFYRMPSPDMIQGWRAQVPPSFSFAIKAPRRVSHVKRLRDSADDVRVLLAALAELGPSFGSLLVQLPPHAKCDVPALEAFLSHLPPTCKTAFEFRNPTWIAPPVLDLLRRHNAALVQSESDDELEPLPWTANWAYLRLRKVAYTERELTTWLERLEDAGVAEAQVFFKHEDAATGPKLALRLLELAKGP